ncbi:AbrB/MazE/SpoVT family DNA-binding domain-containing protein [Mesorhizobium sp. DCY119]|jgi:AbrB family looped-hinge helix DNA binding protein|uniref:AbrB/MazE/SpoVT family DNA-binding domain-containing protein n=1 Tax=Mesorhizobium sp. DCY119 TaxID=2108445 RepID=UPI000E6C8791|nr:AbrB/MazE/SpoVT family DNA-binding domain-containing protein [Mesorhizobium sp. DCY119]RJG43696.1 AbrB/MazE/SpoVT family DNA-binding domain-containing protein [Mesorhizobium sp. DCY119]
MRVTTKGQVTIPKEIRDRLGIEPGSEVEFVERDSAVFLEKRDAPTQQENKTFEEWAASVAGTFDSMGMDGKAYIDWLRGPRDDLDSR